MGRKMYYELPETIDPEDRIYICLPIPDEPAHRRAFAGALGQLTRWWVWERDEDKRGTEVAKVWFAIWRDAMAQMDLKLDSCGGGDMFCCDETNALLNQLLACCRDNRQVTQLTINNYRTEIYNTYSSDPTSIDPDTPKDAYDQDNNDTSAEAAARAAALCWAIEQFTSEVWRQAYEQKQLGLGLVLAGTWILTGGLAGVLITLSGAIVGSLILAAFEDLEAMQEVRCCFYANLQGESVTQAAAQAAIAACVGTGDDHYNQLASLIEIAINDPTNWLLFVKALGGGQKASLAGAASVDPCSCGPETWQAELDFRTGLNGFAFAMGDNSPNGVQDATYGLRSAWTLDNQNGWAQRLWASRSFSPSFSLTSATLTVKGSVPLGINLFVWYVNTAPVSDPVTVGDQTWTFNTPVTVSEMAFGCFPLPAVAGEFDYTGAVKIVINGVGYNPFS